MKVSRFTLWRKPTRVSDATMAHNTQPTGSSILEVSSTYEWTSKTVKVRVVLRRCLR